MCSWRIENENGPIVFSRKLEREKDDEQIDGNPAAVREFSKDVRDNIMKRARGKFPFKRCNKMNI